MRDDLVRNNRWFQWAEGMEHDQSEPSRILLPGRVDPPPDLPPVATNQAHLLATFPTSDDAAEVAARRGGIVVGCTAIFPRLPQGPDEDWWDLEDEHERFPMLAELEAEGADALVYEEGGGYLLYVDIRATAPNDERALAIGRRLFFPEYPVSGQKRPWAPGEVVSEDEVRARLYLFTLLQDGPTPPGDDVERAVAAAFPDPANRVVADSSALEGLLGVSRAPSAGPGPTSWFAHLEAKVDGADVLIGGIWFSNVPLGFPALVGWLRNEDIQEARYDIWKVERP